MVAPKPTAEDLDDLDDDFQQEPASATPSESAAASAKASAPKSDAGDGDGDDPLSDEFVQELTRNMEAFMAQMGQNMPERPAVPDSKAEGGNKSTLAEDEMMKQFERMLSGAKEDASGGKPSTNAPSSDASFQDVIQATMAKLKQSNADANADARAKGANDPSNLFANLGLDGNTDLAQMLEALGNAGEGEGGDMSELSKMLSSMMDDLMNKDVLYEPLKDMHSRFPGFFESSQGKKLSEEERKRYKDQQAIMGDILAVFDEKSYSDSDPACKKRVSDLVSQIYAS
ncbi:Peroxisome chaperone and import receptor [Malassezia brasiliensis]|uniref:Peroxisome chaperone and import receptor n=1 Tax=Malassezia brasiliensis TaxID=1821822 RepID=A0AAF0INU9_9BASI|nr:Peroxisome chaperone and import receptor [Malassezia brasiliensis]